MIIAPKNIVKKTVKNIEEEKSSLLIKREKNIKKEKPVIEKTEESVDIAEFLKEEE